MFKKHESFSRISTITLEKAYEYGLFRRYFSKSAPSIFTRHSQYSIHFYFIVLRSFFFYEIVEKRLE